MFDEEAKVPFKTVGLPDVEAAGVTLEVVVEVPDESAEVQEVAVVEVTVVLDSCPPSCGPGKLKTAPTAAATKMTARTKTFPAPKLKR